jgi:hypothetical protein
MNSDPHMKARNWLCVNPEHLELVDEVPLDYWHRA